MSPLFAFAALLSLPSEPSPYVYKPMVGEKAVYTVRYAVSGSGQRGGLAMTLTTEVLSVDPDGSAQIRLSFADLRATGIAKGQEFPTDDVEAHMDNYGMFANFENLADMTKTLATVFSIPNAALTPGRWTEYPDALGVGIPNTTFEGTLKSQKGARTVFVTRSKGTPDGQMFTRETTFDTERGQLISARLRGGIKNGPRVEMDLDRKAPKQ